LGSPAAAWPFPPGRTRILPTPYSLSRGFLTRFSSLCQT